MTQEGGLVVSPAAVQKLGQDFGRKPVGSGPFQFVEWAPGDHITLKRFDGYWKKDQAGNQLPYLDGMVFQISTDLTVALANLRTGQVDVIYSASSLPPELLLLLKADANLTSVVEKLIHSRGISLNTVRPPFDKKALRQAVVLALDREGIVSALGEGVRPVVSILDPKSWAYDGKAGVYPARDLAKAKAKMAEAGYPSGGLKVTLSSTNDPSTLMKAQIAKANLAEIGIEAEIEVLANVADTAKTGVVGGVYQIAASGGIASIGLPDPGHVFGVHYHSQGARNYFGPYNNPQVDQLLDKAGSIYDQKERTTLYQQAAQIIVDDAPYFPVSGTNLVYPMGKKVRDFPLNAMGSCRGLERTWLAK